MCTVSTTSAATFSKTIRRWRLLGKLALLTDNPRTRELLVTTGRSILEKALDDAGKRGERPRDRTV